MYRCTRQHLSTDRSHEQHDGATGGRKTLCAELLRGVGGILDRGRRFANELGKRDYIVRKMKLTAKEIAKETAGNGREESERAALHLQFCSTESLQNSH